MPAVDPRVTLQFPDPEEVHLIVRVPAKAAQKNFIEQSILNEVFASRDYLATEKMALSSAGLASVSLGKTVQPGK